MELKIRSKSTVPTYTNNNRNLLDAPKHMFKPADISLSPFNLKAKGRKDLRKNKNKILILSNSTYLSCPEMDDNDSVSSSTRNSPSREKGCYTTKLVHNKDDYYELRAAESDYNHSENKKISKLSVRLLSNNDKSYKNIQVELNVFLKGFSYDTTSVKQTYQKLDIEDDLYEKNPKTDFPKYKENKPISKFDLDPDFEEESYTLTASKHRSSCFESRVRSISSILSKLGYVKDDINKEDSD